MAHAAGDAGWVAWTNGVDANKLDKSEASSTYERGHQATIYVSPTGDDAASGMTVSAAKLTISAALTAMGANPGTIILGNGTISAGAGVAWPATAKCGMVGQGKANTIIQAVAQTGPVIDLSTVGLGYNLNDTEFGGFTIWGDNTAGATKKGLALSSTTDLCRANIHDIAVRYTGGACFDLGISEVSDFDRLTAYEPVNAAASDIPYVMATGQFNGNRINGLQLYGTSVGATVGVSGAVVIKGSATYAPGSNEFIAPVAENLHLDTGATIYAFAGNTSTYTDFQFFDNSKIVGATGTSHIRFTDPTPGSTGGNLLRGYIPGRGTTTASIDTGVDMQQSRNQITGVKGYDGFNVTLATGVGNTFAMLGGAEATASVAAFVNNSGTTTNVLIETYGGALAIYGGVLKIGSNGLAISQNGYSIQMDANLVIPATSGVAAFGASVDGTISLNLKPGTVAKKGLVVTPFSGSQTADLATFYSGGGVSTTAILPLGTLIADDATKGFVIKDAAATPHYWRVTVSTAGALTTADLGTTRPTS